MALRDGSVLIFLLKVRDMNNARILFILAFLVTALALGGGVFSSVARAGNTSVTAQGKESTAPSPGVATRNNQPPVAGGTKEKSSATPPKQEATITEEELRKIVSAEVSRQVDLAKGVAKEFYDSGTFVLQVLGVSAAFIGVMLTLMGIVFSRGIKKYLIANVFSEIDGKILSKIQEIKESYLEQVISATDISIRNAVGDFSSALLKAESFTSQFRQESTDREAIAFIEETIMALVTGDEGQVEDSLGKLRGDVLDAQEDSSLKLGRGAKARLKDLLETLKAQKRFRSPELIVIVDVILNRLD